MLLVALVAAICIGGLIRVLLPSAQRERLDLGAQSAWWRIKAAFARLRRRRPNISRADAEREAREAIERASRKRTLH